MSRIGKLPVELPKEVKVEIQKDHFKVSGPKGDVTQKLPEGITLLMQGSTILVERKGSKVSGRMNQGTIRSLLCNMVKGVVQGWSRELELVGTGYRAEISEGNLVISIGFSHPVRFEAQKDIAFKVEKNKITVEGIDRQLVGDMAARIRAVRPPEPYKGKGIMYVGEVVRRKAGKAAKAQVTA